MYLRSPCTKLRVAGTCAIVSHTQFWENVPEYTPSAFLDRWAAPVLTRKERTGCKPNPGFVLLPRKRQHKSDCSVQERGHLVAKLQRRGSLCCYVTPLRLILFMTCNSEYISFTRTNLGLGLQLVLSFCVRTGGAHLVLSHT